MDMKIKVSGVINRIGEIQTFASGFKKREIIVCPNPDKQYPDYLAVSLIKDKVTDADMLRVGDEISVDCWIGGRLAPNGERAYLELKTAGQISVTNSANTDSASADDSIRPTSPADVMRTWLDRNPGKSQNDFVAWVKTVNSKPSKQWTQAETDQAMLAAIGAPAPVDDDDIPF